MKPFEIARPWNPHPYQINAIKWLLEHFGAALFLDPGLGKTSIVLASILLLKQKGLLRKALVIAPLRVCYGVWPKEIEKWADFKDLRITILHGDRKDERLREEADIYVINPEGLDWFEQAGGWKLLDPCTLVVDESSKFKHTDTKRFKLLRPRLKNIMRKWILTGTPAPNGLLDLFGQVFIIDGGLALGRYITQYRNRYFDPTGYGGYTWVPKRGAAEEIQTALKPYVMRLEARDYLKLPDQIDNFIEVVLPPKARKIYDQMEDAMLAELSGEEVVTAMTAAAASMKCRQIANGGLYRQLLNKPLVNSDRWEDIHTAKIDALVDLAEDLNGSPLLVAYDFEHDLQRLKAAFGSATPYIGGGTSPKAGAEIERRWNNGEIPVLLGHPQAMAHGLNLQGSCCHLAWHSLTWNLEDYQQFIQRVLRQGNKNARVFVHHIIAKDTIDEVIMKTLRAKDLTQGSLLRSLKDYAASKRSRCLGSNPWGARQRALPRLG